MRSTQFLNHPEPTMNGIDLLPLGVSHMIGLGAIGSCLGVGLLGAKYLDASAACLAIDLEANREPAAEVCTPRLALGAIAEYVGVASMADVVVRGLIGLAATRGDQHAA